MAGTILISRDSGIPLNSLSFGHTVEKIKPLFAIDNYYYRDEIYSGMDEAGMSFISLVEQGEDGFNVFLEAASKAYEAELEESAISGYKTSWDKLLSALRSDSRAKG